MGFREKVYAILNEFNYHVGDHDDEIILENLREALTLMAHTQRQLEQAVGRSSILIKEIEVRKELHDDLLHNVFGNKW